MSSSSWSSYIKNQQMKSAPQETTRLLADSVRMARETERIGKILKLSLTEYHAHEPFDIF
jgi:hypothetical protein